MADLISDIEELSKRQKAASERREKLIQGKAAVQAELEARRRSLKKLMDEAEAEGFDPNNLREELMQKIEVERTKLNVFESDLETAESLLRPMLEEIRKP